jgi:type VI protein secretion system component Hcp
MGVRRNLSLLVAALALATAPAAAKAQPHGHAAPPSHGKHGPKTIEIEDFSFDVEQVLDVGGQGHADRAGKVRFNPIHITRKTDQASPRLVQSAATGEAFGTVVLDTMRRGKRVKVVLHDVTVSGYHRDGATETFTLQPAYGEIVG